MKQIFDVISNRTLDSNDFPEHKEIIDRIRSKRKMESKLGIKIKSPALMLLTYFLPMLVILLWISLLAFLLLP